jgi:rhodanese-related sulfurtransferase/DNA-binding transcriptional ArsR family regulator
MLNNGQDARSFKTEAYGAFAAVVKGLSSPRRLELVDLLVQGPRPVESLSRGTSQPLASTSQHLQVLKRAGLVETRRQGTTIEYRLAEGVAEVLVGLRRLASARSGELERLRLRFFDEAGAPDVVSRDELQSLRDAGDAVLIDVRPRWEFDQGHIEGAISLPFDELEERCSELPLDSLIIATCRGPYCVFAADAVRMLTAMGRRAARFEDGVAEWRVDGGQVVV